MTRCLAALVGLSFFAACAKSPQSDPEASRLFSEASTRAAVAKPGARVCRRVQTGIAETDVIRGVVVENQNEKIAIRVDNAGRHPHSIGGVALVPKAVVWDDVTSWMPCL
jgi:hypothetical protein